MIITITGPQGCGKSTILSLIYEMLNDRGISVKLVCEDRDEFERVVGSAHYRHDPAGVLTAKLPVTLVEITEPLTEALLEKAYAFVRRNAPPGLISLDRDSSIDEEVAAIRAIGEVIQDLYEQISLLCGNLEKSCRKARSIRGIDEADRVAVDQSQSIDAEPAPPAG